MGNSVLAVALQSGSETVLRLLLQVGVGLAEDQSVLVAIATMSAARREEASAVLGALVELGLDVNLPLSEVRSMLIKETVSVVCKAHLVF